MALTSSRRSWRGGRLPGFAAEMAGRAAAIRRRSVGWEGGKAQGHRRLRVTGGFLVLEQKAADHTGFSDTSNSSKLVEVWSELRQKAIIRFREVGWEELAVKPVVVV